MNHKTKLFNVVNSIIKIIKIIELVKLKPNTINNLLELQELYSKLFKLFITKEKIELDFKKDIDSHIYYLKDRYNDNLALGFWEHLFLLQGKEINNLDNTKNNI